jgi:hypothetical protein
VQPVISVTNVAIFHVHAARVWLSN